MSRGIGEFAIQESIPEWLAVPIAMLTQLGDIWFLVLILGILYWTLEDEQDHVLLVAGIFLAGLGLFLGLKEVFALPRPAEPLIDPALMPWIIRPLYVLTATASGYGFPSGHATGTTIVYFGLAAVLPFGTRRLRYAIATTLVVVVGITRIALGVHYLVDIIAGIAVGLVLLFVAFYLLEHVHSDRVGVTLAVALAMSGFFFVTSGQDLDSVILLGASLGTVGGWQLVQIARGIVTRDRPSEAILPIILRGGIFIGVLVPLVYAVDEGTFAYAAGGVVGVALIIAVVVPIARYSRRVRIVLEGLTFWLKTIWRFSTDAYRALREFVRP